MRLLLIIAVWLLSSFPLYAANIQPSALTYLGSFRVPDGVYNSYQFYYGGRAAAFYPNGNGGAGSLYLAGKHDNSVGEEGYAAEITIPAPVDSASLSDLPTATFLQTFGDITGGEFSANVAPHGISQLDGMLFLPGSKTGNGDKMYWSIWSSYNVGQENTKSQGYSDLSVSSPNAQGAWWIDNFHSQFAAGYLFEIPTAFADTYLGGRYIATGQKREGHNYAYGPVMIAIDPYKYSNASSPEGDELPNTPLLYYDSTHDWIYGNNDRDHWEGAAWLEQGDDSALIYVGQKSSPTYECYGSGTSDVILHNTWVNGVEGGTLWCYNPCSTDHGYHAYPRTSQVVFFDTDDIQAVAQGTLQPYEPQPYTRINLSEIIPNYYKDPLECSAVESTGLAYDRTANQIYIVHSRGDGTKPLIHVLQVGAVAVVSGRVIQAAGLGRVFQLAGSGGVN